MTRQYDLADLRKQGPTFSADAVLGRDGFLLGAEAQYNVSTGQVAGYSAGVGFSAPEYAVAVLATNKLSAFSASYYHRVSRDVEAGGRATYNTTKPADGVSLEVGTKTSVTPVVLYFRCGLTS